jgi:hypothetical protein
MPIEARNPPARAFFHPADHAFRKIMREFRFRISHSFPLLSPRKPRLRGRDEIDLKPGPFETISHSMMGDKPRDSCLPIRP